MSAKTGEEVLGEEVLWVVSAKIDGAPENHEWQSEYVWASSEKEARRRSKFIVKRREMEVTRAECSRRSSLATPGHHPKAAALLGGVPLCRLCVERAVRPVECKIDELHCLINSLNDRMHRLEDVNWMIGKLKNWIGRLAKLQRLVNILKDRVDSLEGRVNTVTLEEMGQ